MANPNLPDEEIQKLLLDVVEEFHDEDRSVRERQVRKCKRLKMYWDNIFQAYYSEVAHDWRIWDASTAVDTNDQAFYDKPINTFRAYIETIIAALSVTTPKAKCFPEDADSSLDIITAKAGDRIGQLIGRHNNDDLLWLRALYTFYTEGTVFGYSYTEANNKYGTYTEPKYKEEAETKLITKCPECGTPVMEDEPVEAFQPENQQLDTCEACGNQVMMVQEEQTFVTTKLVGHDSLPKTRVCTKIFGGLYVKIANYAKEASQTPYLILSQETHFANAVEKYEHLRGNTKLAEGLRQSTGGAYDPYMAWGRLNNLYAGEYPNYVVTERECWLRPCAFNVLKDEEEVKLLKKMYPRGVKVCLVNDEFGAAYHEDLDDYWTISVNPLEDFLMHDPQGVPLVAPQEITNDIIALALQSIEHAIGQTFADPGVLNFDSYRQQETLPGGVYEAVPKSGRSVADAFYQIKTANLGPEVISFFELVQSLAQLVSGALPSLFGGQLEGSDTASEYSMSRAQALQRVQNVWKLFTAWWKESKGKQIPMFINNMKTDEKEVQQAKDGSFFNVFIRRAELEGKIGKIELEASENLPLTWTQINEKITKLFEMQNPIILQMMSDPQNIPQLRDALGLTGFSIPGEDDRNKQYDEIRELLASEPIPDTMAMEASPQVMEGDAIEGETPADPAMQQENAGEIPEMPSVEIDPIFDAHPIHFEIVKKWATSDVGRQAKIDNPLGYRNVLLHGQLHFMEMQMQMQQQAAMGAESGPKKGQGDSKVNGDEDVNAAV